ncbi:hypothetical protein [Duganella sp. HH101]|uniref:hypothetical protein n=1 Tax=Duganella sp. HH101 TaxID=1781066 RepID=UPI000873FA18|nr:hypothetical protein [Duganella sp. HH101]OFA01068.1 hypothetical protein DUGA2_44000 [Duganella sp. HH101]
MSIFREKPAFYYTAVGLLVSYIILTLISLISHLDASGVEQFSYLKHIGMVVLNIYFLSSKNRVFNYLALVWLIVLPYERYVEIYRLVLSGSASLWDLIASIDGLGIFVWMVAVLVLVSKLAVDRYVNPQVIAE